MGQTWKIYKSGQPTTEVRAEVHELEYHGSWMEDEYVSVSVRSATPVNFQYGDYMFYRTIRYEINYDPNFLKKARSGSYGEGFVYDNIKLYPVSVKLKDVAFKDVVLNNPSDPANALVYSSLGTFSFFAGSVEDLADRIMANLNRDYSGEWKVYTPYKIRSIQRNGGEGAWGAYYNGSGGSVEGKTEMNIECQNLSCLDALKMAYTNFDLSFYVRGKNIIIGGKPISADYGFEYGKGNGLYEIERTHDESQRIVTKLYAYGSDKNLPLNYYANIGKKVKIPIVHKTKREITMGNPQLVMWVDKEWTKSIDNAFAPSYEVKLTYGNISARFGVSHDTYNYAEEQDDSTLDHTTDYMFFWTLSSHSEAQAFFNAVPAGASVYVTGVNINQMPSEWIEIPSSYNYDAALSIYKLMLPGFPTMSLFEWVSRNGATNINAATGYAVWRGYAAYFSKNANDPWIRSVNAAVVGVREGTVEFDSSSDTEIFPSIEGTGFDEVAWCEQIDDNGHIDKELTFKLQPAAVNGSDGNIEWDYGGASISMKDGYCVGREFEVENAKVNDDGDWELTMKRKKDDSLGVYFPYKSGSGNLYQIMGRGNHHGLMAGDHFVILGIPLPQTYVELAAAKLLEEALKHLAKVDHQAYTYLPRIDEIEMARQHDRAMASGGSIVSVHDTICAGMQMQIDDDDLNVHYAPFIDSITIKENGNNGIPTYDVVLRDEKEMTMQERIQSQIDGGKDAIINALTPEGQWLSKLSDDTAQGMITFLRGLQVGERFVPGLLGEGGVFRKEEDGTTYIEADKLYIRMKAYFDSVEIREYHHTGGNRIASVAGARCCRVEWIDSNGDVLEKTQANLPSVVKFRCYFMGNDGEDEVRNNWVTGDLAYCHVTTVETDDDSPVAKGLNMKHYWRRVVGRNATGTLTVKGEHWIDLSNVSGQYQSGSDIPEAQDDIVQLGNVSDTTRQGAIIEFVTGADAPSYQIFQGISDFSLTGKNYVRFGYDSSSGGAQAYIGNPDGSTYLWYHRVTEGGVTFPRLDIKANVKFTSPFGDETTIEDFASAVTGDIEDLQAQIDGEIDTWYYSGVPTLSNAPANEWTTDDDKNNHLGDLYYDKDTGNAYRFLLDEGTYKWVQIHDDAVTEALRIANEAKDAADGKRRVFLSTPYPPYDNGDLWVNAVWPESGAQQGETYNNDILRCRTSKTAEQVFSISDWVLASKYTDDSALVDFVTNTYAQDLENIETQMDKKAETWYQDTDPSTAWNTAELKAQHVGDIWCDTSNNGGRKTYIFRSRTNGGTTTYYWAEQSVPDEVFDQIDGKAAVYVAWNAWMTGSTNNLNEKDLFIPAADTTQGGVTYKANKVYRCTNATTPTFEEIRYTDDSALVSFLAEYSQTLTGINNGILAAQSAANTASGQATEAKEEADDAAALAAASTYLRDAMLDNTGGQQATDIVGGLVLTSLIALRDVNRRVMAGISGTYQSQESGTGYKGHGIAAWYGGGMVDGEVTTGANNAAKSLFRFDGSGYVANKNLSWDKNGNVTIQGYSINATTLQANGSPVATEGMLADYVTLATAQTITGAKTFTGGVTANRLYLYKPNAGNDTNAVYIEYDSANAGLHLVGAGFYTDSYVSALGVSSGGGGGSVTLNEPLNSINNAGLATPTYNGSVLVYSGGAWKYSSAANIFATGLTVAGTATAAGFSATGRDNTYVLLAGGGTKLLSEIGGGLAQPLSGINDSDIGAPSISGSALVYHGGEWKYSPYANIVVNGITVNGNSTFVGNINVAGTSSAAGFSATGKDDAYVLLAGGGTKLLSEITNGRVASITIGNGGTNYTPNASGIITIPSYPSTSGLVSGISVNGGNPLTPSSGIVSLGDMVKSVKINGTVYSTNRNGLIDLGTITSTDTTNTTGATNLTGYKLYLTGASSQATSPVTYTNSNCYIGTDNCLYSNGTKVLTSHQSLSGYVQGIAISGEQNPRTPVSGIVSIPRIPTKTSQLTNDSGFLTSHQSLSGYATQSWVTSQGYTKNTGTVTGVIVSGAQSPCPMSGGIVTIPAYPTVPTKVSQLTNDSGFITSSSLSGYATQTWVTSRGYITSYTDTKNTAGTANNANAKMYLVASGTVATSAVTYTNSNCYIGTDNCLYSGGVKVLTSHQSLSGYATQSWVTSQGYTKNAGTVTGVIVSGAQSPCPMNSGVVTIPAYPTVYTKTSQLTNDSGFITGITRAMVTTALGYTPPTSDTNTWRTVQCNGNSIGSNALNLVAGSNVSISASNGTLTFASTNTTYGTVTASAAGLCPKLVNNTTTYLRGDGNWATPTDTKNTAGTTATTNTKLFVVGASAQASSATTNTHSYCWINPDGAYVNSRGTGRAYSFGATGVEHYIGCDVASASDPKMYIISTTSSHSMTFRTNNTERLRIWADGKVAINKDTKQNTFKFFVQTDTTDKYIGGTAAWTNSSDIRKKNVINNISLETWQIANAPIFRFRWKNSDPDNDIHVGTSAQYWRSIVPELIAEAGDGTLLMEYGTAALVAAVTTAKKVQDHETRIQALERENAYLKNELKRLTA